MFLKKKLALLLVPLLVVLALPVASFADTGSQTASQGQQLSLSEAIKMAQNSNATLLQDQLAVQMANNNSTNASQGYAAVGGANAGSSSNSGQASAFNNMVSNNNALQNASLSLSAEQNNIIYTTETAYFKVQDAVYGEQVAQEAVQVAQEAYQLAQVEELQGVQTQAYVTQAKSALDLAQSKLTQATTGVATAYVNFDNTVGLDPTARPELTSVATYDPNYDSGLADVQEAVSKTLQNNQTAQIDKNAYNLAVQEEDTYQGVNGNAPLSVENAGLTYQLAIQGLTTSATAAFLTVGYDQDAYNAAAKAVTVAQATYSNDQASYNAGVITKYQLDSDEANLMSANQSLQADLHQLLDDQANLALITGVGSVNVTVSDNQN